MFQRFRSWIFENSSFYKIDITARHTGKNDWNCYFVQASSQFHLYHSIIRLNWRVLCEDECFSTTKINNSGSGTLHRKYNNKISNPNYQMFQESMILRHLLFQINRIEIKSKPSYGSQTNHQENKRDFGATCGRNILSKKKL